MTGGLKTLTRCAIISALGCATLYASALLPSGRLAGVAAAGIVTAAAVIHCGPGPALSVFAVTAVLGMILLPSKENAVLYSLFFGYYPVAKSVFERLGSAPLRWAAKLVLFNAVFFVIWTMGRQLLAAEMPDFPALLPLAWAASNAAFVVFDLGFTKLIAFYLAKISKRL